MKVMFENNVIISFAPDNYEPGNLYEGEILEVKGFGFPRVFDEDGKDDISRNGVRDEEGNFKFTIDKKGIVRRI